ncbi:MAG: hypothetical protein ACFFDN_49830 [Candidatus Hodarchaeota archaeon]
MKIKRKLFGISLLTSLLLLTSVNISHAVPPTWVGVSDGDSFEWTITVHNAPLLTLMEDLNLTYGMPPEYSDLFVGVSSMNYRIDILSVSDELDYIGIKYVNVSCSVSLVLPGTTTIPNIGQFSNIIVKFQDN